MKETPDQVRGEVERARQRLAADLNALEYRVTTVTDWRWQYRRHTWAVLGAAFVGALALGYLLSPSADHNR